MKQIELHVRNYTYKEVLKLIMKPIILINQLKQVKVVHKILYLDWFLNELIRSENYITFFFKNTKKNFNSTKEDEEPFGYKNICWFCGKYISSCKVRDNFHLAGDYRNQANEVCKINVEGK